MHRERRRFQVENTWCVESSRQPNWVLSDLKTGKVYRYFLLIQVEEQIEKLSGCLVTGARSQENGYPL